MPKKKTTEQFIKEAQEVWGEDKYDYSQAVYIKSSEKVKVKCIKHDEWFYQGVNSHLRGREGCYKCRRENLLNTRKSQRKTNKEFLTQAINTHGSKFDYSLTEYVRSSEKVRIRCKKHDTVFFITANSHLNGGGGCPECRRENVLAASKLRRRTNEDFIVQANKVHGDKYDYSECNYRDSYTKVKIRCIKHNKIFEQLPYAHLKGEGCPECGKEITRKALSSNTNDFIKKAKKVHGDTYDYSNVIYKNKLDKVRIICPEHGEFEQAPDIHLRGGGCPRCNRSKGENKISSVLNDLGFSFKEQVSFPLCRYKYPLRFDFGIYDKDEKLIYLIEYDGEFHYKPIAMQKDWSDEKCEDILNTQKLRDEIKNQYCKENHIPLLRIPFWDFNRIETILEKELFNNE